MTSKDGFTTRLETNNPTRSNEKKVSVPYMYTYTMHTPCLNTEHMHKKHQSESTHIIAHITNEHLRITVADYVDTYKNEYFKAYKSQVKDEHIAVFHLCGDFFQRIISDVEFRRFRGVSLMRVAEGVYKHTGSYMSSSWSAWFTDTFVPWISSMIKRCYEDIDETLYDYYGFGLKSVNWKDTSTDSYVYVWGVGTEAVFKLKQMEDGHLSKMHFIALVKSYCKIMCDHILDRHYSQIAKNCAPDTVTATETMSDLDEFHVNRIKSRLENAMLTLVPVPADKADEIMREISIPLSMTSCRSMRLSKDCLTSTQVEYILSSCIRNSNTVLFDICTSKEYNELTYRLSADVDAYNNHVYDIYARFDGSEEGDNICLDIFFDLPDVGSRDNVTESISDRKWFQRKGLQTNDELKAIQSSIKSVLQINSIDNTVIISEEPFSTLSEFNRIAEIENEFAGVVELLKSVTINDQFVDELENVVTNLRSFFPGHTCADVDAKDMPKNQRELTENYVRTYKDDNVETVASQVISDVAKYLISVGCMKEQDINKTQIPQDLLQFGVQKTRKSKGFVYGIHEFKPASMPPASQQTFVTRPGTVGTRRQKTADVLRPEPPVSTGHVLPWMTRQT